MRKTKKKKQKNGKKSIWKERNRLAFILCEKSNEYYFLWLSSYRYTSYILVTNVLILKNLDYYLNDPRLSFFYFVRVLLLLFPLLYLHFLFYFFSAAVFCFAFFFCFWYNSSSSFFRSIIYLVTDYHCLLLVIFPLLTKKFRSHLAFIWNPTHSRFFMFSSIQYIYILY